MLQPTTPARLELPDEDFAFLAHFLDVEDRRSPDNHLTWHREGTQVLSTDEFYLWRKTKQLSTNTLLMQLFSRGDHCMSLGRSVRLA